jgi:hypothetical protein
MKPSSTSSMALAASKTRKAKLNQARVRGNSHTNIEKGQFIGRFYLHQYALASALLRPMIPARREMVRDHDS